MDEPKLRVRRRMLDNFQQQQHRYYGSMNNRHDSDINTSTTVSLTEGEEGKTSQSEGELSASGGVDHTVTMGNKTKESTRGCSSGKTSAQSPSGRSLDAFLEDAYKEHSTSLFSLFHQYQYWLIMLSLVIGNSSDASEILCLSYILSDSTFQENMLQDDNWRGSLLAAAVFAGMLMGGLVVGTLGDFLGRRPMLILGLMINMTAGILSACAPNVLILAALRLIAGVGIGATVPPLFTLAAELAPPSKRGLCVTFCASFWMVGSVFVALVAIVILRKENINEDNNKVDNEHGDADLIQASLFEPVAWRVFAMVCALPSAIGAAMVYVLVPESPRFLALQSRFDESLGSVNTLGSALKYHGPTMHRWELEQQFGVACSSASNYHPSIEGEIVTGDSGSSFCCCMMTVRWVRLALADFFTSARKLYTPSLRQTTWPLQMVWFSLSFGSYGLMTWINTLFFAVHLEDVYFNALLFALSNLPGNLFTAYFMDRAGRAQLLVGSILSASMSLLAFAAFANTAPTSPPNTYGIVISACSFQCFTIAAWNTIDVMTSELFPTTVRSTGMGVCAASGRIGAMVAQFVNGALVGRPVRLLVVASVTLAMGAMTPFMLPQRGDMTGQPVKDDIRKTTLDNDSEQEGMLQEGTDLSEEEDPLKTSGLTKHPEPAPSSLGLSRRGGGGAPNLNNLGSYQRVSSAMEE